MRFSRSISKFISVLLIALLMQKMGAGLYMHNWLHEQKEISTTSTQTGIYTAGYNCNCIDDFCTPYSEPDATVLQQLPEAKSEFVLLNTTSFPLFSKYFHSLRAPPVCNS